MQTDLMWRPHHPTNGMPAVPCVACCRACVWHLKTGDFAGQWRWSCAPKLGGDCVISYDLGQEYSLSQLRLCKQKGPGERSRVFRRRKGQLVARRQAGRKDELGALMMLPCVAPKSCFARKSSHFFLSKVNLYE